MADLNAQRERGDRARRLMEDPLLQEGFAAIEKALLTALKDTKAEEAARRDDCWRSLKLLDNLKAHLVLAMGNGNAAAGELLRIEEQKKRLRLFGRS